MRRAAALGLVFLALAAGFLLWGRATRAAGRAPPVAPATPPAASAPRPAPAGNLCVDLAFTDGDMPVPVDPPFAHRIEVTALDGGGELDYPESGDPCRVKVTKAGRYRVSFPAAIEGYEPIAPVEVDVVPGKIPRIEVQIKRRER